MATLELTDEQILGLIKQVPYERRRAILYALAEVTAADRDAAGHEVERRLAKTAAERGLDWDSMSEDEREQFIDELVHEERAWRRG